MVALKTVLFILLLAVTGGALYLILRSGGEPIAINLGSFRWLGLPLIAASAIIYLYGSL